MNTERVELSTGWEDLGKCSFCVIGLDQGVAHLSLGLCPFCHRPARATVARVCVAGGRRSAGSAGPRELGPEGGGRRCSAEAGVRIEMEITKK